MASSYSIITRLPEPNFVHSRTSPVHRLSSREYSYNDYFSVPRGTEAVYCRRSGAYGMTKILREMDLMSRLFKLRAKRQTVNNGEYYWNEICTLLNWVLFPPIDVTTEVLVCPIDIDIIPIILGFNSHDTSAI